ncbi:hypothetical protein FACS1894184_13970 [Clostridia bacterium]|nr:hypothetical protein FACS1894184_13970 [Clostridia bacterium]
MLRIEYAARMKRDIKRMSKRGKDIEKLESVLSALANGEKLPASFKDHQLKGDLKDLRECHIEPDWLLVYKIIRQQLLLIAVGTGTHDEELNK